MHLQCCVVILNAMLYFQTIKGEVWEVDDAMFSFLDDFEGHPEVYERDKVKVLVDNNSKGDAA